MESTASSEESQTPEVVFRFNYPRDLSIEPNRIISARCRLCSPTFRIVHKATYYNRTAQIQGLKLQAKFQDGRKGGTVNV